MTDPELKIPIILEMVYPISWLNASADDHSGLTNREIETLNYRRRIEVTRPQTFIGSISQMSAALTHHVTPARLQRISASIPKVLLLTGDDDHLVNPANTRTMKKHMKDAELVEWEETGHAIHFQRKAKFNALLERVFKEGRERAAAELRTKMT